MRRVMILLCCLALPVASAETGPAALAKQVNARVDWAGDLDKCPADLFSSSSQQDYSRSVRQQCTTQSGQAACMAACKSGKGEHCYWLGTALQASAPDDKASIILFQRSCKLAGC